MNRKIMIQGSNIFLLTLVATAFPTVNAFTNTPASKAFIYPKTIVTSHVNEQTVKSQLCMASITSPFDSDDEYVAQEYVEPEYTATPSGEETLELTWDNVDMVLDEMRPYLIQDGGNVAISEIDGPIVRLELEGECGTCPSSTQTMKMGLERRLRERIPEIQEVIQALPEGPELNVEQVEVILEGVRPFLQVAGGTIECESITGEGGVQPIIMLKMEGSSASLHSVKLEIAQRLQRHFMMAGLKVEWG